MFKARAMIHSLKDTDLVLILHENGANDVIAEYNSKRFTAVYNPFVGLYYVDDVYGELVNQDKCPFCNTYIPLLSA